LREIRGIRQRQPRVGGRKLQRMINEELRREGIEIGRDRMFDLLRENKLLVEPKRRYARTTQSRHRFKTYKNLIRDIEVIKREQVFVSDITYIETMEGYCYLSLITDLYTRKIVGYSLSKDLTIEGNIKSLKMALRGVNNTEGLIHHSDRGIQYCSKGYVEILERHKIQISMTEENHIYENAKAERLNGILKDELMLGEKIVSYEVAERLVKEAVEIYNGERLHMALGYITPAQKYAA
jgi:transposase InsO family protein